jgi:hypothetical protein
MSLGLLVIISVLTAACYGMTFFTEKNTETLRTTIAKLDTDIAGSSVDRNIVIAKIVQENTLRPSLDLKNIVAQFRIASAKGNVAFDGFSIKDDVITTNLTSTVGNGQHPDAVGTIIKMMNDYSAGGQEFRLGKITSITGDTTSRTTAIELRVIPTPNR